MTAASRRTRRATSLPSMTQSTFQPFAGRPVLMSSRTCRAAATASSLNAAKLTMAARSTSLFFTAKPLAIQRFFTAAINSYSGSGMVKLSRTSLGFFGLAPLPALATLEAIGAVVSSLAENLATDFSTALAKVGSTALAARLVADFGCRAGLRFSGAAGAGIPVDGTHVPGAAVLISAESGCGEFLDAETLFMATPQTR